MTSAIVVDEWMGPAIYRVCGHHGKDGLSFKVCVVSTGDPNYGSHFEEEDNEM